MNNKVLIAGLAAGVVSFFYGWVMYGMLLADFFAANMGSASGVNRGPEEMDFAMLTMGNLAFGFLMAFIASWAGANNFVSGLKIGLVVGLFAGLGFNGMMMGTTHISTMNAMLADVAVFTVMIGLVGGVAAALLGRGGAKATA